MTITLNKVESAKAIREYVERMGFVPAKGKNVIVEEIVGEGLRFIIEIEEPSNNKI